jgi:squalene-associated FAD-dependent desaturase
VSERPSVLVVGGGLAGLATACDLADAGVRVTLIEKRPFLGGRAYSYRDKASGLEVDNGQHVFLGCCTEYIGFLKRLGVYENAHLQKRLRVPVIDKVWGESLLESRNLPPPLHLLPSLLRFRSLSPGEKAMAGYAMARLRSLNRGAHPELDGITFGEWLSDHRQSANAIRSLWNLIVQPTLNDDASRVCADLALMVFQEGFLGSRDGANVGWAKVGLSTLLGEAARRYIEERGGEVTLSAGLEAVKIERGRVSGISVDGGEIRADGYVVALPPEGLLSVLPRKLQDEPFFSRVRGIGTSPIVNVHLWYDRAVWDGRFAAFLNTPLQWAFNKSKLWGLEEGGQYIDISLSGAHEFVEMPAQEIVTLFSKEAQSLFPMARTAELKRVLVVKQRDATFAAKPGIGALRPSQATPVPNLYLAGDWTDTGWPATMESAVRSGTKAAQAVLHPVARETTGKEVISVN